MQAKLLGFHLRPRFRQQLLLATIAALVTLAFFLLLPSPDTIWRLSMGTAYASLLFLAAALIIGPLKVLRSAPNPVSTYLRRDIGIVAGVLALAHTIIGLLVHFRGDPIRYFFYRTAAGIGSLRSDLFGVANYVGLAASVLVLILLAISNNMSLRMVGAARWKGIQRWNYVGAILVVAHGLLYQAIEKRIPGFVITLLIIAAATTILQLLGFRRRKEQLKQSSLPVLSQGHSDT